MSLSSVKRFFRKYPLACICLLAIWYLCLFKPPHTRLSEITNFDKVVHVTMYLGTCSVIWWEYLRSHNRMHWGKLALLAVVAPILMSGLIELAQAYLTTNRSGDWIDFAANSVGVLLAALVGCFVLPRFIHSRKVSQ